MHHISCIFIRCCVSAVLALPLAGLVRADDGYEPEARDSAELPYVLHINPALLGAPVASTPEEASAGSLPPRLLRPDTPPDPMPWSSLIGLPAEAALSGIPKKNAGNCMQRDDAGRFMGWIDQQHCVFSGRTLATAVWFDDLFGDWHDNQAALMLRAITEANMVEGEGTGFRFRLRASAALPNAKRRLRLVVTDDSDADESVAGQDVRSQLNSTRDQVSAALRWIPLHRAGIQSDFDIGVRGLGPPDLFVRARLRKNWSVSQDSVLRFGETLRYGTESHGRSITQLDYEYAFGSSALARLSSAYEYQQDERDRGFIWAHGISMSHVLSAYRSLGYGFTVNGFTQPNWHDDNYGPWVLFRSNWLRPWLFYELEPRATWYDEDPADVDATAAPVKSGPVLSLTLRIEIQLGRK